MSEPAATPPVLRIVAGGAPSDEETAALAAVLAAVAGDVPDEPPVGPGRWRDSSRTGVPWAQPGWLAAARRAALRRPQ